ncbi:reverse transcriptase domain-containing protein [Tanacetum coccineum]
MVKEGIVLGHKVSSAGLKVDKAKIDVISKLPLPTNIKGVKSFLGHACFYRRFIKDFSKIARPITKLLEKDTPFEFNDECQKAFKILKEKLTCAPAIDRKGTENVAADPLSQIENDESSDDSEVDDNFPGETLMEINTKDEPWFADFANHMVANIIPKGMTYQQKNKSFSDLKHYFWEEPYLFKECSDGMIRRCVSKPETRTILDQCHHGLTSGHYGPNLTAKKVLDSVLILVLQWAEAQALPTNDVRVVVTFLKKLFCRFGMPKALISDQDTHFCNKIMEKTMKRYGVNHHFSTSYHPQTSGQVENTNRALKRILEKTVKDNPAIWSRKFDDAL